MSLCSAVHCAKHTVINRNPLLETRTATQQGAAMLKKQYERWWVSLMSNDIKLHV